MKRLSFGFGGVLLGLGIIYLAGWSLMMGSTVIPSDMDEIPCRIVAMTGSEPGEDPIGAIAAVIGYGKALDELQDRGFIASRLMFAVAVDGKPWGFVNTMRFVQNAQLQYYGVQYVGLAAGLLVLFCGFAFPIGRRAKRRG